MNYQRPELRDALASEYVLGTLHGPARRRFQQLLRADPQLQAAVDFWQNQLLPMAAPLSVAKPSPRLWAGIAARIAPPGTESVPSWFERWFGMRSLASLVTGLFVGIGVTLSLPPTLPMSDRGDAPSPAATQIPASYAGILSGGDGQPAMLISSRRHGKLVDIKVLRPIGLGQDQVLRLWALSKQGPPLALGIVPAQGKGRLELPATSEALLAQVDELAVSVESAAGLAPGATPTYILRGPCAKFW
jgi:anti-sigma-K factor RskA